MNAQEAHRLTVESQPACKERLKTELLAKVEDAAQHGQFETVIVVPEKYLKDATNILEGLHYKVSPGKQQSGSVLKVDWSQQA